ncbi:dnaJ homolog subfamily C member 7-like isoform X1 [Watersipora subatra]|uniref:dnaJ homolog subfamily C member 7-like isoform X1 n=1 Tax=Watersipora subatra TaxID=2589382 RepID=UPI00355C6001
MESKVKIMCRRIDIANAESLKQNGNELYKQKKYMEALEMYSQAIRLLPCAAYYGNRSATYMMLNKYNDALADAQEATSIDKEFTKGYQREGKCLLALGNPVAAIQSFNKSLVIEPNNQTLIAERESALKMKEHEEEAHRHYSSGDFRRALFCISQCLNTAPNAVSYRLFKAECFAFLSKYTEASDIVNTILAVDNRNADALFVRGLCLYYGDEIDKAQQHFKHVLRMNPDHTKAKDTYKKSKCLIQKKEEGNAAFKSGDHQKAYELYTDALSIDPYNKLTNAKLYCNRATTSTKLQNLQQAVDDCNKAIELDEKYVKAFTRRAATYTGLEMYEEAVRDYETVQKLEPSQQNARAVKDAKLELKKSKRKDYYKILGVDKNVTDDMLRKAYRKRAMLHHPDRHCNDTPEKQKEEEKIFKDVGEAYAVLSDPKKRSRYDSGADLEEGMGSGFGDFDATNLFQMFFQGGAPDFGGGFEGFGGSHRRQHQRSGFPGGGYQFHF